MIRPEHTAAGTRSRRARVTGRSTSSRGLPHAKGHAVLLPVQFAGGLTSNASTCAGAAGRPAAVRPARPRPARSGPRQGGDRARAMDDNAVGDEVVAVLHVQIPSVLLAKRGDLQHPLNSEARIPVVCS
jgi:hypothetical protein